MLAKLAVQAHGTSTRVLQLIVLNPKFDLIRASALDFCRDGSLVFNQRLDTFPVEIVLATLERAHAREAEVKIEERLAELLEKRRDESAEARIDAPAIRLNALRLRNGVKGEEAFMIRK